MVFSVSKFKAILLAILLFVLWGCDEQKKQTVVSPVQPVESLEKTMAISKKETAKILALGDSLTAGLRVQEHETYPALLQKRLDRLGYSYQVVNGGESGGTSKGGVARLEWFLEEKPKIVILELGGNDALRGLAVKEVKNNLEKIIQRSQQQQAQVLLVGMLSPPNVGRQYSEAFKEVYINLAKQYNLVFMPFFLEGVVGNRNLNQKDGIHPIPEGYKIIEENLWQYLKPMLSKP